MKPYGREKNIKGHGYWKIDHRIRVNGRKIMNWWEAETDNFIPRSAMNRMAVEEGMIDYDGRYDEDHEEYMIIRDLFYKDCD